MKMNIEFRRPRPTDGAALHQLVKACPPLDENSLYCNLLQVTHFADTAIVAEHEGELVGFITGFHPPGREDVLFVWQVAVSTEARGQRLGDRMLRTLAAWHPDVTYFETTVTPDNVPSTRMFERFAKNSGADIARSVLFSRDEHFAGEHDDEVLFRIGPISIRGQDTDNEPTPIRKANS